MEVNGGNDFSGPWYNMNEIYINTLVDELEDGRQHNILCLACKAIMHLAGSHKQPSNIPITKRDISPCPSADEVLDQWKTYCESLLNHTPAERCAELCDLASYISADPGTDLPSLKEARKAIQKLWDGHATGPDGIPHKLLKGALEPVSTGLFQLFLKVWASGSLPSAWRDGITVPLYKCGNSRLISLVTSLLKVFAHIPLGSMQLLLNSHHHPQQSSVTAG